MKTIKLSPNWTLQGSKIALAILVALSVTLLGASILMLLLPVLLFITLLNFLELRFLHCYKAGICYSRGLGKRYINAEDIVTVEFNPMAFITVFMQGECIFLLFRGNLVIKKPPPVRVFFVQKIKNTIHVLERKVSGLLTLL